MSATRARALLPLLALAALLALPAAGSGQTGTAEPQTQAPPQQDALRGVPGIMVIPPHDAPAGGQSRPGAAEPGAADAPRGCPFQGNRLELIV